MAGVDVLLFVLVIVVMANAFEINEGQELVSVAFANSGADTVECLLIHCGLPSIACSIDEQCRKALECNAKCQKEAQQNSCDLLCELTYGYNSTRYKSLLQCMADHQCLPKASIDGKCLAEDSQTLKNLTSMDQVKGKWWILKGLNCGQPGWEAGFDAFPCQRDEFVFQEDRWIDHIAYCGGSNDTCSTPIVNTKANVSITSPGVMTHWYLDAPLLPQIEEWRVLSWPHPDWMLYIYCGSTPNGAYAGGSVVSRMSRSIEDIPEYVKDEFITVAEEFGFSYDEMCTSDVSTCQD